MSLLRQKLRTYTCSTCPRQLRHVLQLTSIETVADNVPAAFTRHAIKTRGIRFGKFPGFSKQLWGSVNKINFFSPFFPVSTCNKIAMSSICKCLCLQYFIFQLFIKQSALPCFQNIPHYYVHYNITTHSQ